MSNDLNNCSFIGRLGKDVDVRYMTDGKAVASFSIAVGSQWKSKSGDKQESTEWVNISAFGKLAEICAEYLVKGSQIFVSGKMKTDKYKDKEGVERYSTKIIADNIQMLGGKSENTGAPQATASKLNQQKPPVERDDYAPKASGAFDNFDDDLPF